jgi:YggT family protein
VFVICCSLCLLPSAKRLERRRLCEGHHEPRHEYRLGEYSQLQPKRTLSSKSELRLVMDDSSLLLAAAEPWVQPLSTVLGTFFNFMSLAMLSRVVLSWYPEAKITDSPWIFFVFPTEPLLKMVKGVVPPAFGVDITPVFWLAIFTFFNEILLGQQGLLTMKMKYGI